MSSEKKRITLKSSDDELFTVDEAAAMESNTIKVMLDGIISDAPVPLLNVTGTVLAKVIEYCQKHVEAGKADTDNVAVFDELAASPPPFMDWDADFVKDLDHDLLFGLISAANYLDIEGLLDLTCKSVGDRMRGKSAEDMRKMFNIKNDNTPDEEEEIRRENEWAFV